jgi:hypothetical protein
MKKIAITAKEAYKLAGTLGVCISEDGTTFYATNETKTEIWEFDTKRERDVFVGNEKKKSTENDIMKEVDARYSLAGYNPEGFEDNMYSIKLGILAEMYEVDEATGKLTRERDSAYGKIAEKLEIMGGWN